jgi:hypothetical protein
MTSLDYILFVLTSLKASYGFQRATSSRSTVVVLWKSGYENIKSGMEGLMEVVSLK